MESKKEQKKELSLNEQEKTKQMQDCDGKRPCKAEHFFAQLERCKICKKIY